MILLGIDASKGPPTVPLWKSANVETSHEYCKSSPDQVGPSQLVIAVRAYSSYKQEQDPKEQTNTCHVLCVFVVVGRTCYP